MKFDREKFKRLFHYVVWKAGDSPGFGATKLYKILWFSDARAYVLHKKPITGAVYIREKYGPVPKAALPIQNDLEKSQAIRVWQDRHFDKPIRRFQSRSVPDMSIFDEMEIEIIDYWIEHIDKDHTASSISEETHDYAWEIAAMGEEIPYQALLATRVREPTEEEFEWAKRRAKELNLP